MKVGVFDSGVGGLTVLKELLSKVSYADFVFYGDSKNSPYGMKTIAQVREFCHDIVKFLVNEKKCDMIVIACNTATYASIDSLKEEFPNIPIIGVISPGADMAVEATKNKKIGVLSTVLTAKSNAYMDAINKLDKECEVYQQGAPLLVPMIEAGWKSNKESMDILKDYIDEFPSDIDTIVLGCTHFPFVTEDLKTLGDFTIINPAIETTKIVIEELDKLEKSGLKNRKTNPTVEYFVSGDKEKFESVAETLMDGKIKNLSQI